MLKLQDLSDIPEVFSTILCFLQITDTAVLATPYFAFRDNISRCIRNLVLDRKCCNNQEWYRAVRLFQSPINGREFPLPPSKIHSHRLPWITSETRLQFVHVSIDLDVEANNCLFYTLKYLLTGGYFYHVTHFCDNMDTLRITAEDCSEEEEVVGNEVAYDLIKHLGLQNVPVSMMKTQHFSIVDSPLVSNGDNIPEVLSARKWPTLEILNMGGISWFVNDLHIQGLFEDGVLHWSNVLNSFQKKRFPSVKAVNCKGLESDHLFAVVEWLLSACSTCSRGCREDAPRSLSGAISVEDSVWGHVEEVTLGDMIPTSEMDDYEEAQESVFQTKEAWLALFRSCGGGGRTAGFTAIPCLFPRVRRITLSGVTPCWQLMRVFERGSASIYTSSPPQTETYTCSNLWQSNSDSGRCYADVFSPCPCVRCLALPSAHSLRHGGVALSCYSDDAEMAMYFSDFLLPDRLPIAHLNISERSRPLGFYEKHNAEYLEDNFGFDDDGGGSGGSDGDADDSLSDAGKRVFSSVRKGSIYGGLLDALERNSLPSLRHLCVNESFLYVCGCYSEEPNEESSPFLSLRQCECLEELAIDLDLYPHSRSVVMVGGYNAVLRTFFQTSLVPVLDMGALLHLREVNFIVGSPTEYTCIASAVKGALRGMSADVNACAASADELPPCFLSLGDKGIALRVSISGGLKNCRVGYLSRSRIDT